MVTLRRILMASVTTRTRKSTIEKKVLLCEGSEAKANFNVSSGCPWNSSTRCNNALFPDRVR